MSALELEALLARLYSDPAFAAAVLRDAAAAARDAGLDDDAARLLLGIDRVGLELATRSFAWKRARHST